MSVTEPETISSSQQRPRAIAFTRRARRSIRVGRTSLLGMPCGTRICLDFLDGGFCHGIESKWSAASDVSCGMKSEAGMTGQELVSPRCVKLASSLLTILSQDRIPIDPSAALAGIGCGDEPDR